MCCAVFLQGRDGCFVHNSEIFSLFQFFFPRGVMRHSRQQRALSPNKPLDKKITLHFSLFKDCMYGVLRNHHGVK